METKIHDQLGALAHPRRLDVFRLLMRRYPDAVPAGEIAQALDLKPNTASVYFAALKQAGLIENFRHGTSLQYSVNLSSVRDLFANLLGNCCQNRPDLCLSLPNRTWDDPMKRENKSFNVLFICTGNSARSILAEAILRVEGAGRFNAWSAGTQPATVPHPEVISLLEGKGIDTSDLRSKSLEEFSGPAAPKMDFVFTVCDHAANEECPAWPGQPMSAHWGLPDPVRSTGTDAQKHLAFQQTYGLLRNRIAAFVNLPFATLDRISLQHNVDDIGRMSQTDDFAR